MIHSLAFELEFRNDWAWIPLRGILRLLDGEGYATPTGHQPLT